MCCFSCVSRSLHFFHFTFITNHLKLSDDIMSFFTSAILNFNLLSWISSLRPFSDSQLTIYESTTHFDQINGKPSWKCARLNTYFTPYNKQKGGEEQRHRSFEYSYVSVPSFILSSSCIFWYPCGTAMNIMKISVNILYAILTYQLFQGKFFFHENGIKTK